MAWRLRAQHAVGRFCGVADRHFRKHPVYCVAGADHPQVWGSSAADGERLNRAGGWAASYTAEADRIVG